MDKLTEYLFPRIPHYYGDTVRNLFLLIVLITFVAVPFYGNLLPVGNWEIIGGVILVALAGFTNPKSRWIMVANAFAAAFGAILLELAVIAELGSQTIVLLAVRELLAVLCLIALYLSMRTIRAMSQHTIGTYPHPWDFDEKSRPTGE